MIQNMAVVVNDEGVTVNTKLEGKGELEAMV